MKIVTDCAADLKKEEAEALNIQVAPLFIQFPEGEVSSNDITPDEFYQTIEKDCSTHPNNLTTIRRNFYEYL